MNNSMAIGPEFRTLLNNQRVYDLGLKPQVGIKGFRDLTGYLSASTWAFYYTDDKLKPEPHIPS